MALVEVERRVVEGGRDDSPVVVLRLANGKVNALSQAVLAELADIAEHLAAEPPGAVVVTGGDRIFAAGADVTEFGGPDEAADITGGFHRALDAVAAIPRLVIAAVSGYALGGGCELALACDYRIASAKAVLGQPEIHLGIIPGGGGTQRLARAVGVSRAKELMITGRQVRADEALAIGLVDEIVDHDVLHDRAFALASEAARGAVRAHALVKRAVDEGIGRELWEGLLLERELFAEVFHTDDSRVGVRSFLEQGPGKASFSGR